ncbi:hypothetical protein Tdes44962_MAKER05699 [Teratosphaeria destructans]|uniref:Rhodopsin domain-containing protein n=1 Tax=Teratosphaeria destructans TaxID=418781 RepID=A0A9W7VYQ9_9PEZI|nr:hypothetical protein Tdes44962_MAKER05699 [Teratosphaeria destructans]
MSDLDQSVEVLILVVSLCLIYTLIIAGVRIWIRRKGFDVDDFVIAFATLLILSNSAADYVAMAEGLGTPWSEVQERRSSVSALNEAVLAGVVTFILALYLSKCAMLCFLCRITKTPSQLKLFHICIAVIGTLGFISLFVASVGCRFDSGYYWAFYLNRTSCSSQGARWQVVTAFDVISEVVLLALPVHLVWGLQMPKTKKAMILIAFYLRLPVLGFTIGRYYYIGKLQHANADPTKASAIVIIWAVVELSYAVAASTLCALKAFTESFSSGFGLAFTRSEASYGMSGLSGSSGRTLKTEKSKVSSAFDSTGRSRMGSITPLKTDMEVAVSPISPQNDPNRLESGLQLRPERELRSCTRITADPDYDTDSFLALSNCVTHDDLVILRETGYEIQHHDQAPMLPAHLRG